MLRYTAVALNFRDKIRARKKHPSRGGLIYDAVAVTVASGI